MTLHEQAMVVSEKAGKRSGPKGTMHNVFIPPVLIFSFLLALAALVLNTINPGIAAVVGATSALIFMAIVIGWGR